MSSMQNQTSGVDADGLRPHVPWEGRDTVALRVLAMLLREFGETVEPERGQCHRRGRQGVSVYGRHLGRAPVAGSAGLWRPAVRLPGVRGAGGREALLMANAPTPDPDGKTLSIDQARTVVGVSRRTIYNWIKAGKLPYKRTLGGSIRIYEESLWQHGTRRETPKEPA